MDISQGRVLKRSLQDIVSAAKGTGINFFGRMYEQAGRFLFGLILARFMGAEQYGIYALALATLTVVSGMALLGLDVSVVRFTPIFRNHEDEDSLWGLILMGLSLPLLVGALAGMNVVIFADSLCDFFSEPRLNGVLPLVALGIPLSAVLLVASQATVGFKQMRYRVIVQDIIITSVKLVLVIPLAYVGLDALRAMAVHTVGVMVACGAVFYLLNRLFSLNRPIISARFGLKKVFGFSLPVYVSQLITLLEGHFQIILLGILSSSVYVGIFFAAFRMSMIGIAFYNSMVIAAMPHISDLHSRNEWRQLGHFYQILTKWSFAFNLPIFLAFILFPRAFLSIFGKTFVPGASAFVLLALANLIDAGTVICVPMLTMTQRPWLNMVDSLLGLAATIGFGLWLIPTMGLVGAGLSVAAAALIPNAVRLVQIFVLFRLWPYNWSFIKPIVAGFVALSATCLLNRLVLASLGTIGLVLNIFVLLAAYTTMILLQGLDNEERVIFESVGRELRPWLQKWFCSPIGKT